jgi:hypothetical protein
VDNVEATWYIGLSKQEPEESRKIMGKPKLIAIDPYDCGCTECITGEHVPLVDATDAQIARLITGQLMNNTGVNLTVNAVHAVQPADDGGVELELVRINAVAELSYDGFTKDWDISEYLTVSPVTVKAKRLCANCDHEALPGAAYCSWACKNEDDRHDN